MRCSDKMPDIETCKEKLESALNECRRKILLYAQSSLPESQFEAFRKLVLNELGKSGLEGKAMALLEAMGKERAGSR